MELFETKHLTFKYPGADRPALDSVDLKINRGEFLLLAGTSGSGKSTLLRHFKPSAVPHGSRTGEVFYAGKPLSELSARDAAAKIGFVFQSPDDQIVSTRVRTELAFGPESIGMPRDTMRRRIAEVCNFFGISHLLDREISELSGGQKQTIALAGVLVMGNSAIVLDEPTAQLDPISATEFTSLLRRINLELGVTVIVSEHRFDDLFSAADRFVLLEKGRVIFDGSPREAAQTGNSAHQKMLPTTARAFIGVGYSEHAVLTVNEGRRILGEDGFDFTPTEQSVSHENTAPILRARDCMFRYKKDGEDILRNFETEIYPGEILGVLGSTGAGKTTAFKMLAGLRKPYAGRVTFMGKDLAKSRPGGIVYLPQDPRAGFLRTTVEEELRTAASAAFPSNPEEADRAFERSLDEMNLRDKLTSHPYDLSGGESGRLALAKALVGRPALLLLDEPTKGMDPAFKEELGELLREIRSDGTAVAIVSHDIAFCASYCDSVAMLFDGEITARGSTKEFFAQNRFYTTPIRKLTADYADNIVTLEDFSAHVTYRK